MLRCNELYVSRPLFFIGTALILQQLPLMEFRCTSSRVLELPLKPGITPRTIVSLCTTKVCLAYCSRHRQRSSLFAQDNAWISQTTTSPTAPSCRSGSARMETRTKFGPFRKGPVIRLNEIFTRFFMFIPTRLKITGHGY